VKELAKGGQSIVTVRAGQGFEKVGAEEYVIRAGAREDYDRLLVELGEAMPERIVHLWSGGGKSKLSGREKFRAEQERGFYSVLYLAQALAGRNVSRPLQW